MYKARKGSVLPARRTHLVAGEVAGMLQAHCGTADTMVAIPLNCGVQLSRPSVAHTCPSRRTP